MGIGEYERQKEFINPIYHDKINQINYEYLIGQKAEILAQMDTGIKLMLELQNKEQLSDLYKLL